MCQTHCETRPPRIRPRRVANKPATPQPPALPPVQLTPVILEPAKTLQILGPSGEAWLNIAWSAQGPVIQLAQEQVSLDISGKLNIAAAEIALVARQGDVVVRGETIRLN